MDLNYRSTSNIVEASTRLISNNVIGFKKHLKAVSEEEGEPIYIARRYSTEKTKRIILQSLHYVYGGEQ